MTDQELKDLVASLAVKSDRLDEQLARTDAQLAQTDTKFEEKLSQMQAETRADLIESARVLKEVSRRMGAMASNQGDVAEEFFFNSLDAKPQIGNITFDSVTPNQIFSRKGSSSEFDIVMVNGQSVALIEVKYKAHVSDLDQVEEQVQRYRKWRPEHKDYKIYSGLAGFSVPPDVVKEAQQRGLFVLKRTGDVIEAETGAMKAF
jgi:Holliday junction resolvase-like predicted endonuclease